MTTGLSPYAHDWVDDLVRAPTLTRSSATLAVVMALERFVRREEELFDQVNGHAALRSYPDFQDAVRQLLDQGWLESTWDEYAGVNLIESASILPSTIRELLGERSRLHFDAELLKRETEDRRIQDIVSMRDARAYSELHSFIDEARDDIAILLLRTGYNVSYLDNLQRQAKENVRVRVVLATADLVVERRGGRSLRSARENIRGWHQSAKSHRTFDIRVTRSYADLREAGSFMVDREKVRYVLYDDLTQRPIQGFVVKTENTDLSRTFAERFDEIWMRARPVGFWAHVRWLCRRWWWLVGIGIIAIGLGVLRRDNPAAFSLFLGALLGYLMDRSGRVWFHLAKILEAVSIARRK